MTIITNKKINWVIWEVKKEEVLTSGGGTISEGVQR